MANKHLPKDIDWQECYNRHYGKENQNNGISSEGESDLDEESRPASILSSFDDKVIHLYPETGRIKKERKKAKTKAADLNVSKPKKAEAKSFSSLQVDDELFVLDVAAAIELQENASLEEGNKPDENVNCPSVNNTEELLNTFLSDIMKPVLSRRDKRNRPVVRPTSLTNSEVCEIERFYRENDGECYFKQNIAAFETNMQNIESDTNTRKKRKRRKRNKSAKSEAAGEKEPIVKDSDDYDCGWDIVKSRGRKNGGRNETEKMDVSNSGAAKKGGLNKPCEKTQKVKTGAVKKAEATARRSEHSDEKVDVKKLGASKKTNPKKSDKRGQETHQMERNDLLAELFPPSSKSPSQLKLKMLLRQLLRLYSPETEEDSERSAFNEPSFADILTVSSANKQSGEAVDICLNKGGNCMCRVCLKALARSFIYGEKTLEDIWFEDVEENNVRDCDSMEVPDDQSIVPYDGREPGTSDVEEITDEVPLQSDYYSRFRELTTMDVYTLSNERLISFCEEVLGKERPSLNADTGVVTLKPPPSTH